MMTSQAIRQAFITYFQTRGHLKLPPSSLVPVGDPSVLFTTAGMQQFKPYYTQPELASSARVITVQPSVRTSDIEEVGDNRHLTMFEMLGNFSFGYQTGQLETLDSATPYFKKVAIQLAYQFIHQILKISDDRISVTVYAGNPERKIARDTESANIWAELGLAPEKVKFEADDNFWGPTGSEGPCGPTSEIYIDGIEVWNLVFNQFYCSADQQLRPLDYLGVDTGAGLERLALVLQDKKDVFSTDLFAPIIKTIEENAPAAQNNQLAARVIADHLKASLFLIADGVRPSNKAQGYVLRRLIRRAALHARQIKLETAGIDRIVEAIYQLYSPTYDRLSTEYGLTQLILREELAKFNKTVDRGLNELEKLISNSSGHTLPSEAVFRLFDTYGFPVELTAELAAQAGLAIDPAAFAARFKAHQERSRAGINQTFKGGLADHEPATIAHHTAHHLLLAALRQVLGDHVHQQGSNVTAERLRLDFSHPDRLSPKQLREVETIVNQAISANLEIKHETMSRSEAEQSGALAEFGTKYGDHVSVYTIVNTDGSVFSRELCGGPHVDRTGQLSQFTILKEEGSAAGTRRIKARTEPPKR